MSDKNPYLIDPPIAQFLFLASHGLRAPLTNIRWGLEILEKKQVGELDATQLELIQELHMSSKEISRILKGMFILERIERGVFESDIQEVNILNELKGIDAAQRKIMGNHSVECEFSIEDTMSLVADKSILYEVLYNTIYTYAHASGDPKKVSIKAEYTSDGIQIFFHSNILVLPKLNTHEQSNPLEFTHEEHVGGTPGLLLYLAINFAKALGGAIEIQQGELKDDYTIVFTCPRMSSGL